MNRAGVVVIVALFILYPFQCTLGSAVDSEEPTSPAPWPTDEWGRSSPEEQGMDSTVLDSMIQYYSASNIQVDSFLVVRNGWMVLERYMHDHDSEDRHHLFSCTKSITSTLLGIAARMGYVESIDTPISDYFPELTSNTTDQAKKAIRIRNLLQMTSGFEWNEEHYGKVLNDYDRMVRSENWVSFVLEKPMVSQPGETFLYNSGVSHLLSAIITMATGNSTLDFAISNLFRPIGISGYDWEMDPQGFYNGASKMKLTPEDMARIGYLYLRNGTWNDARILDESWVEMTAAALVPVDGSLSYSLQWWVAPNIGAYFALGWGYQSIIVVPRYDLVVVVTAATLEPSLRPDTLLQRWILPSLGATYNAFTPFRLHPVLFIVGVSPVAVLAVVWVMNGVGLWEEDSKVKEKAD
jgi:CubicO group peptidase (beta-lactamase class C family)